MYRIMILDKVGLKIPTSLNTITLKGNKETLLNDSEYKAIKENQTFKDMVKSGLIIVKNEIINELADDVDNNEVINDSLENEMPEKKRGRPKQEKN